MSMKPKYYFLALTIVSMLLGLNGCTEKPDTPLPASPVSAPASAPTGPASAGAPAVTVSTVRAQQRDLPVVLKATGTVMPLTSVDIKPQVSSVVSKVHIRDGQFVRAGELLFTLDARSDEANLAKARAQLAKDTAASKDAQRQLVRAQQLLAQNFVSQGAVDTAQTQLDSMAASLAADQAAIDAVNVALSYARILAPHAGRAGAVNVATGSAVQANASSLVTITQLDPIAVGFNLPQRNLPDALMALKNGGSTVTATISGGGNPTFTGKLQFVDNAVDPSSGSVKVKAVFDNKEGKLWPGVFVDVSQTINTLLGAVVLPQAAIIPAARGTIVYVVENGKAVLRPVQVTYAQGDVAAVTGVAVGELIVMDGKQNLRPNTPVLERAPKDGAANAARGGASRPATAASKNSMQPATP